MPLDEIEVDPDTFIAFYEAMGDEINGDYVPNTSLGKLFKAVKCCQWIERLQKTGELETELAVMRGKALRFPRSPDVVEI